VPNDVNKITGAWVFRCRLPATSYYTTGNGWRMEARVSDDLLGTATSTTSFDVNLYIKYSVSPISTISPGHPAEFILSYTSNAIIKIQVSATDPTSNSTGTSFPASYVTLSDSMDGGGAHTMHLSNQLTDWYLNLPAAQNAVVGMWWMVTIPDGSPNSVYQFAYAVNVTFQAYA
jgi:hypothetical protein